MSIKYKVSLFNLNLFYFVFVVVFVFVFVEEEFVPWLLESSLVQCRLLSPTIPFRGYLILELILDQVHNMERNNGISWFAVGYYRPLKKKREENLCYYYCRHVLVVVVAGV